MVGAWGRRQEITKQEEARKQSRELFSADGDGNIMSAHKRQRREQALNFRCPKRSC